MPMYVQDHLSRGRWILFSCWLSKIIKTTFLYDQSAKKPKKKNHRVLFIEQSPFHNNSEAKFPKEDRS